MKGPERIAAAPVSGEHYRRWEFSPPVPGEVVEEEFGLAVVVSCRRALRVGWHLVSFRRLSEEEKLAWEVTGR